MNIGDAAGSSIDHVLNALGTTISGLSSDEARRRLAQYGPNEIGVQSRSLGKLIAEQTRNGINLLLTGAGILTIVTGDLVDGAIILLLIVLNVGLSILQEYRAERALAALRSLLQIKARVLRDGVEIALPANQIVPGGIHSRGANALALRQAERAQPVGHSGVLGRVRRDRQPDRSRIPQDPRCRSALRPRLSPA